MTLGTKVDLTKHIERVVAGWPPLTGEQVDLIASLLSGQDLPKTPPPPSKYQVALRLVQAKRAELERAQASLPNVVASCGACGLPKAAHAAQASSGIGFHSFVAMTPEHAIKAIKTLQRKIKTLEDGVRELEAEMEPLR